MQAIKTTEKRLTCGFPASALNRMDLLMPDPMAARERFAVKLRVDKRK